MKRKIVELDTKSKAQERGFGDAPGLGRAAKVAGSTSPRDPGGRDPYEDDEEPAESGEWLIRLGMISALMIGLIVGGGLIYYTAVSKLGSGPMSIPQTASPVGEETRDVEPTRTADMIAEEEALDLVRRALATRFASKVSDHFRSTPSLDAQAVVEFLKGLSASNGLVERIEWLGPVTMKGVNIGWVRVHFQSTDQENFRDAYLLKDSKGEWKIDYDSFANQSEPKIVGVPEGQPQP